MSEEHRLPERDRPWVMRTYAGHSDARRSNELYRENLAKGQTGLSIAFDLPTQTGYDPDHVLARGEVGKVGVSIVNKGDMHQLLDGIPLGEMNTSMTINATAAWLLGLYVTVAEENGVERDALAGTTQNDIIKEFLARGTYAFPPGPSMRLIADMVAFTVNEIPKWNPINVCSYHLQEAGATPVQEVAYALSTAIAVLDEVKARGQVADEDFPKVFGRISFFVNAGVRFIEEHAKLRAMTRLWEQIGRERYGVTEPKLLRMRYGVQVNSLGLTESQPENNVPRIVLEALAVTMGRDARARAIQLPAWNEALGLPRPWDQQWSLRIQQILANETDLLDYPDIFEGSNVMEGLTDELAEGAQAEMKQVDEQGGAVEAVPYMKAQLVESNRERLAKIERGEITVVGQNKFTGVRGLPAHDRRGRRHPHPRPRGRARADRGARGMEGRARPGRGRRGARRPRRGRRRRERQRHARDDRRRQGRRHHRRVVHDAARGLRRLPRPDRRHRRPAGRRQPSCSRRPRPTSRRSRTASATRSASSSPSPASTATPTAPSRSRSAPATSAWRSSTRASASRPDEIAASAIQEDVDVVGLSILSGSHLRARPPRRRADPRRGRRHPGDRRRDHPAGPRLQAERRRHRARLHAEGLRDQPDHGRDRRPRRRARRAQPSRHPSRLSP